MEWQKLSPEEKAKFLSRQLKDIQEARALLDRFERLTLKWSKRVQAVRTGAKNTQYKVGPKREERRDEKTAEKQMPRR